MKLSALAVAANAADHAAALVLDDAAAIGAGAFAKDAFFMLHLAAVGFYVRLNGLGHRVGAGKDLVFTEAGWRMAGNALQLFDDLARLKPAAPGQRHHASNGFALGCGAAARFTHRGEEFK